MIGLRGLNGVLRCLDHGDLVSRNNGQINHSVEDTLCELDLWELHGLLLERISSSSVWHCSTNCACGISTVFVILGMVGSCLCAWTGILMVLSMSCN